jgi:hypothetical protein
MRTNSTSHTTASRSGQGGSVQASADGWVLLPSDAVARLAAAELLNKPEVPNTLHASLLSATSGSSDALKRIRVWVDLSALHLLDRQRDAAQWRRAAMGYLIARQAHFGMLKELFKATRAEVTAMRKELNAEFPNTKPKAIPTAGLDGIYKAWAELSALECSASDRWVALGERFPEYPIASLYAAIVIEPGAGTTRGTGRKP